MRKTLSIEIENIAQFKKNLISYARKFEIVLLLDSVDYYNSAKKVAFHDYDLVAGLGCISALSVNSGDPFEKLKDFYLENRDWLFGHFSYDLKNQIENLDSKHPDNIDFPEINFFVPEWVITINGSILSILYPNNYNEANALALINDIQNSAIQKSESQFFGFKPRFSREEYFSTLGKIKQHIQNGDIYEMNLCQEFYSEDCLINPYAIFSKLCDISPAPFSAFYKVANKFLISASPERFLKKTGQKVVSQPIKGTFARGKNLLEDKLLAEMLRNDEKEKSENVMIVDLVRNDLSKTAKTGSVKVSELFGIYEFPQVFQMISTVESVLKDEINFVDLIKGTFPMGSMTGAPKIRAMQIIEEYERTKRGLYSGSVGYISPEGDFDFNVVIRSLQYNSEKKYLSYIVGGAITSKSVAEKEYKECLLKAEALNKVLL